MATIRNVAWFGTGGNGLPALHAVASSGKFHVTLMLRNNTTLGQTKVLPSGVKIVQVDFSQLPTLVNALRGHEAVVVFTRFAPGSGLDTLQIPLIDAAIQAGVKLFVPSEWAPDTAGGNAATSSHIGLATIPPTGVIGPKRAVHNYLFARAAEGKISFAILYPGVILASALRVRSLDFNFQSREALLPDNGIHPFSTTSIQTLGAAVVGLLLHYPDTKNRLLYIADGVTTQHDLLKVVERVREEKWTRKSFPIIENKELAEKRIQEGIYGIKEFRAVLALPFFGGLTVWKSLDNSLLGIEDEDLVDPRDEMARIAVSEIPLNPNI